MILAGIDEAGYGPLLGPLVVSCAAFEVPDALGDGALPTEVEALPCLWTLLGRAVVKKNSGGARGRVLVADSKLVHNLSDGKRLLERGVLAFLPDSPLGGGRADTLEMLDLERLVQRLDCTKHGLRDHPWYGLTDGAPASGAARADRLPRWCDGADLMLATSMVRAAGDQAGVHLRTLRTALVCEGRYNRLVERTNNKASALISITLSHLHYLHTTYGHQGLVVGVDKQGGRDHYTQLLMQTFPETSLKVLREDGGGSSYLLTQQGAVAPTAAARDDAGNGDRSPHPRQAGGYRRTVIHFREKGETHFLATALASMTCKYLRELAMEAFNAWWCARVPGLTPTAGYYQDGTRWLADVAPHLESLGISREQLVRVK
jgi:hypothetical protein